MGVRAMDAKYLREKAGICARLANGLSLNNPGRFQLMNMAEELQRRAAEFEVRTAQQLEYSEIKK
jgi:hypothetical protein